MSRYILMRITEDFGCYASLHPKPYKGDWNGSGGHTNFSTKQMREEEGINIIIKACEKLKENHNEHMQVYGKYNDERLTGLHETSSINDFSWGFSDRNKSIRIPLNVVKNACGYLEDRRPASNLDPYLVTDILMLTTYDPAQAQAQAQ
jgi:glutamine synthetase